MLKEKEKIARKKAADAVYRRDNKDKIRARRVIYLAAHPEKVKAQAAIRAKRHATHQEQERALRIAWYEKNGEQQRAKRRAAYRAQDKTAKRLRDVRWMAANREKERKRRALWKKSNRSKDNAMAARRNARKLRATPLWANHFFIEEAYDLAQRRTTATGFKWHVDHIVPLQSKRVCGLHVENNLQVIPAEHNVAKGNRHWPDMPQYAGIPA